MPAPETSNDRVAIVAGLRTPFVKTGTSFKGLGALELATAAVKELLHRSQVPPKEITLCVFGHTIPTLKWLNFAREIVLGAGLPRTVDALSISRACATSIQTLTSAAQDIRDRQHDAAIVGGAESSTDVPFAVLRQLAQAVEAAEKMAKENGISRVEQDVIAHRSHQNAARAWSDGTFAPEVMTLVPPSGAPVVRDNQVQADASLDTFAALAPVLDKRAGTVTTGNATPLTDGASALLVMRESKARALGLSPLGFLKSFAYAAVDPDWQLLMAPAFAVPKALDRAGLTLSDMDLVEVHEAVAAQVASNLQALASNEFCTRMLGRPALGEVDPSKLNVNGGSLAIGHPFGATGGRMVLSTLRELTKRHGRHALVTMCTAGGLGAAVVLEVD